MHKPGWIHTLQWNNPHTSPPEGLPRVLGKWADCSPSLADFREVYPAYRLGCGYGHHINFPEGKPRRKQDAATNARRKERARKTLEMNRVRAKLPLLADVIIEQEGLNWRAG